MNRGVPLKEVLAGMIIWRAQDERVGLMWVAVVMSYCPSLLMLLLMAMISFVYFFCDFLQHW